MKFVRQVFIFGMCVPYLVVTQDITIESYPYVPIEVIEEIAKQDTPNCAQVQDMLDTLDRISRWSRVNGYFKNRHAHILVPIQEKCSPALRERALETALLTGRWRSARLLVEMGTDIVKVLTVKRYEESEMLDHTFNVLGRVLFTPDLGWNEKKTVSWVEHVFDLLTLARTLEPLYPQNFKVQRIFEPVIKSYQPLLFSLIIYHKYEYIEKLLDFVQPYPDLVHALVHTLMGQREQVTCLLYMIEMLPAQKAFMYVQKLVAVIGEQKSLLKFLLETPDNKVGNIPLIAAVKQKNIPLLMLLLRIGQEIKSNHVDIRNRLGKKAADYAKMSGEPEIKRLLSVS